MFRDGFEHLTFAAAALTFCPATRVGQVGRIKSWDFHGETLPHDESMGINGTPTYLNGCFFMVDVGSMYGIFTYYIYHKKAFM